MLLFKSYNVVFSAKIEGITNTRPVSMTDNVDNLDGLSRTAYERRITRLEQENKELTRKLSETTKTLQDVAHGHGLTTEENKNQDDNLIKLREENSSQLQKISG